MNLSHKRALPFALAAASLTFGTGCSDDGDSGDGGTNMGPDGGSSDGGAPGSDGGATGGDGGQTTGDAGGNGTSGGDGGTDGGGTGGDGGTRFAAISEFSRTVCSRLEECDPSALAAEFGDEESCVEDRDQYYLPYYTELADDSLDPAACEAALDSYFECLTGLYTGTSCEELTAEDFDTADCYAAADVADLDCGV